MSTRAPLEMMDHTSSFIYSPTIIAGPSLEGFLSRLEYGSPSKNYMYTDDGMLKRS